MRELTITLKVKVPDHVTDDDVLSLVNDILDVGYADACDTVDDPDINNPDVDFVAELEIGHPTLDRCFDLLVEIVAYRCSAGDRKLYTFEPDMAEAIRYLASRGVCTITSDNRGVVYATLEGK